jgi:hypothetical protein
LFYTNGYSHLGTRVFLLASKGEKKVLLLAFKGEIRVSSLLFNGVSQLLLETCTKQKYVYNIDILFSQTFVLTTFSSCPNIISLCQEIISQSRVTMFKRYIYSIYLKHFLGNKTKTVCKPFIYHAIMQIYIYNLPIKFMSY